MAAFRSGCILSLITYLILLLSPLLSSSFTHSQAGSLQKMHYFFSNTFVKSLEWLVDLAWFMCFRPKRYVCVGKQGRDCSYPDCMNWEWALIHSSFIFIHLLSAHYVIDVILGSGVIIVNNIVKVSAFIFSKDIFWFIWLCWVLVVAGRIFSCGRWTFVACRI